MNLQDVVDKEFGLRHSELDGTRYGANNQLEIIGWSGKQQYNKFHIVKCDICSLDRELFGEGYFKIIKQNLDKGSLPCGCSKIPKWTKHQYEVMLRRKIELTDYNFLGWVGDYIGGKSFVSMDCKKHGEWSSTTAASFLQGGHSCGGCKIETIIQKCTIPDDVMISRFFSTGSFVVGTEFRRISKPTKSGSSWNVFCPTCGETNESKATRLQTGQMPCSCVFKRATKCYINLVKDGDLVVALKFGKTAHRGSFRKHQQAAKSVFTVEEFGTWEFESSTLCSKVEMYIKKNLNCGVVKKLEMPSGYTETTSPLDLEKIIAIYESYGGIQV